MKWTIEQIENRLKYLWGQYEGKYKHNPFIGSEITFLQEIHKHLKGQSPQNHAPLSKGSSSKEQNVSEDEPLGRGEGLSWPKDNPRAKHHTIEVWTTEP